MAAVVRRWSVGGAPTRAGDEPEAPAVVQRDEAVLEGDGDDERRLERVIEDDGANQHAAGEHH